ncbi:MAG: lactate utilization protein [Paludibacter sp.]
MQNNSRQEILKRIAAAPKGQLASVYTTPDESALIYKPILPDSTTCFKNELEAVNGVCILCENESDLYDKLRSFVKQHNYPYIFCRDSYISGQLSKNEIPFSANEADFESMQVGITGCEFLVARTGSVIVSSAAPSGRQMNVFPPIHIVLAHISQLVNYPEDGLTAIYEKYENSLPSTISTITGPSRTADIEKTLVLGAHGPKEFIVFLSKV